MAIISATVQSRWKDSYASSATAGLTLRANGEERTQLITPHGQMVLAGIDAPTVAPTLTVSVGGVLAASKWYCYAYVYASSQYPGVENAVTGGNGELWPRSNPSPVPTSVVTTAPNKTITVRMTKTTRSDIDKIWVYRSGPFGTQAEADKAANAAQMFYVATVGNDALAGYASYTDTGVTSTSELLEADNYVAPTFQLTVFDGNYWWGIGNNEFVESVQLSGDALVTFPSGKWFSGRNGMVCTFDGITTGGFDGLGSFYFKFVTNTTAQMCSDIALVTPIAIPATGTTTMRIRGYSTTLYRSKVRNPFSWGFTETQISGTGTDQTTISVPQEYALRLGGGFATALATVPNERLLKIDLAGPTRTYILNLELEGQSDFEGSAQLIDEKRSVGSHFAQFSATQESGNSIINGLDAKSYSVLQSDGQTQQPISSDVFETMRRILKDDNAAQFFHGVYDHRTELNCFWVKTVDHATTYDSKKCDTMVYYHAPSGFWGAMPFLDTTASATIYDRASDETLTLLGDAVGNIGIGFAEDSTNMGVGNFGSDTLCGTVSGYDGGSFIFKAQSKTGTVSGPSSNMTVGCTGHGLSTGDSVYITNSTTAGHYGATYIITVVDADSFNLNAANAATYSETVNVWPDFSYAWFYITDALGGNEAWVQAAAAGNPLDSAIRIHGVINNVYKDDNGTLSTDSFANFASGSKGFLSPIPCRLRRYFDLNKPSGNKKPQEAWATMQNLDSSGQQLVRFFSEYDSAPTSSFDLNQTLLQNSTVSAGHVSKTAVPSDLVRAFGIEYVERGFEDFTLLNFTIKLKDAS